MTDDMWTAEFWDERYSSSERIWSGAKSWVGTCTKWALTRSYCSGRVGGLVPGSAVDIGCGEGADVLWLAHRGWRATGVDLSQVALDRGAARAAQEGVEATWLQADLLAETLPEQYDLVSAHFVHVPTQLFAPLHTRL
ncbi:MAG: class I SAM-dependent methyltransferase, partial [Nocardioides sp.]|nr:class I SAM-dependent methyltransferase [Nocardioides sp.]